MVIGAAGTGKTTIQKASTAGLKVTPKNTDAVTITIPSSVTNYKNAWSSIVFAIRDNTTGNGTQITEQELV